MRRAGRPLPADAVVANGRFLKEWGRIGSAIV